MTENKIYCGDSVYAEYDGFGVQLTTENGMGPSNTIYLEPAVVSKLWEFYCGKSVLAVNVPVK